MIFNQNAYSQFGSNYSPSMPGSQPASPEDGYGASRGTQPKPMAPGTMGFPQPSSGSRPPAASPTATQGKPLPGMAPQPQPASPTAGMTWSQMQQQGYARPPFPAPTTGTPDLPIGVEFHVGGSPSGPAGAPPLTLEQRLTQAYQGYQGMPSFANPVQGSPIDQTTAQSVQSLLNQPSPYLTDAFQSQLKQTMGAIDDQYNQADQALHQNIARRGLDTAGTIGAGDQRYNNLLRRSAQSDAANNLLNQLATTYGSDRANAIQAAMGYTGQQYGQAQNTYATNLGANAQNFGQQTTALQNLLGYGQQAFQNQLQTAAFNQNQDQTNTQLLLQLLGAGY